MVEGRTRERQPQYFTGTRRYKDPGMVNEGTITRKGFISSGLCVDTIGNPKGDNLFTLEMRRNESTGITATVGGQYYRIYNNYPWTAAETPTGHIQFPIGPTSPISAAMARSNPGKPNLSLPVAIAELRDLPKTYRSIAGYLRNPKSITNSHGFGGSYITWNFGIAPMIGDIQKLIDFAGNVERTRKRLQDLYDGDGMQRSGSLDQGSRMTTTFGTLFQTDVGYTQGNIVKFTEKKMWYSARWKPTTRPPDGGNEGMLKLARKVAFGVNGPPSLEDIWNLLPWSWLMDYFINLGDVLGAGRNSVPATCVSCCVMTQTETSEKYIPTVGQTYGASLTKYASSKYRTVMGGTTPNNVGHIQTLDAYQLSILGALALTRGKSRR